MEAADRLYAAGVRPDDVVVLAGEHDARLITLFVASLYVGATPTIGPYPTTFSRPLLYQQRLIDVVRTSQARAILALPAVTPFLAEQLEGSNCIVLDLIALSEVTSPANALRPLFGKSLSSDPAYVQFSSGATGTPKGAIVSHATALRHLQMLTTVLSLNGNDVLVGWAPFYHDLGLVVYLLLPLVSGLPVVTMSPGYWVRHPQVLPRTLHDYRGTCPTLALPTSHAMSGSATWWILT